MLVEPKCESYHDALHFKVALRDELGKVRNAGVKERLLRGGCNVCCVALAMSIEGAVGVEDLGLERFEGDSERRPLF